MCIMTSLCMNLLVSKIIIYEKLIILQIVYVTYSR